MYKFLVLFLFTLVFTINYSFSFSSDISIYRDSSKTEINEVEEEVVDEEKSETLDEIVESSEIADSTTISEIKEDEIAEKYFTINPSIQIKSEQVQNGIYVSKERPAFVYGIDISHSSGLSFAFNHTNVISKSLPYLNTALSIGYDYDINSFLTTGIFYSRTFYQNDNENQLSQTPNNLGASLSFMIPHFLTDLSYNELFGTNNIRNLSLSFITYFKVFSKLKITPLTSITVTNYKLTSTKLSKTLTKNTGISNISAMLKFGYEIIDDLNLSLSPSFSYTPLKDLSVKKYNTNVTFNIDYSFDLKY